MSKRFGSVKRGYSSRRRSVRLIGLRTCPYISKRISGGRGRVLMGRVCFGVPLGRPGVVVWFSSLVVESWELCVVGDMALKGELRSIDYEWVVSHGSRA